MATLKVDNFQAKIDVAAAELEVLNFWDQIHAFEESVKRRPENKRYVFYDGPPFATGLPHYGHILVSTIKDMIPRYQTMKGYRVERVWGWDCHGIPIENMIEKELGLVGGKKGIEALGIDKFNNACRLAILRFDKEWEKQIKRIGRWVDFANSYKTMDRTFMESVWWAFAQLHSKGFVYEGKRVILYCPRCATPLSNFEIAMDNSYKDLPGPSTVYKYKLKNQQNTYLLAWSTTPWNKLATPALAVNPVLEYVKVAQGDEQYILAKNRLVMLNQNPEYKIIATYTGKELEQFEFELHYDFYPNRKPEEKAGVIIADGYVTSEEGTGIVTLAVYGEDDYRVMTEHSVQLVYHVDAEGKLYPEVTPWAGMFMLKVNPLVNEDLGKRGLIYHDEERVHSVPVCYRCETRLYQAPVPAWFINIQTLKKEMLAQNEQINWYPTHLKHGRFGKGLETAPDWNISRSRYWGTPMPVWRSQQATSDKQQATRIIGSLEELKKWAVDPAKIEALTDIHREFLDDIEVWVDDDKTVKGRRIPEVFDCWVESGSMPYASLHYPFENKDVFENTHPAQFITEYIAQTRAWFYTLHVMSVGLFGSHTYDNAVTTGNILGTDGFKMSKSKKNYPDPVPFFEKYGVDALRFYLMSSVVMKAENIAFSEDGVKEVYQRLISTTWNVLCFYKLYAGKVAISELVNQPVHELDRWIVSLTARTIRDVTLAFDEYDCPVACRLLQNFVTDLSTWYLRRSRDRLKQSPESVAVFGWVLLQLAKLMAPITPFIAERMYQNLGSLAGSVHWENWPVPEIKWIDDDLESAMHTVRAIVETLHAMRKEKAIGVRQPLASVVLVSAQGQIFAKHPGLLLIIADELNIRKVLEDVNNPKGVGLAQKEIQINGVGGIAIYLDTTLSPELKQEGEIRDLIRQIQALRKEKKCALQDKIQLSLPDKFKDFPDKLLDVLKHETLVDTLVWSKSTIPSIG